MKEKVAVKLCKCILLLCVLFAQWGHAEEEITKERKLKAAYVLNFIKYMSWPVDSGAQNEFRLCVHSDEPFYHFMQALVTRHNQGANKVRIVVGHTLQEPLCHLAYFQSSIEQSLIQIRRAVVVVESLDVKQVHAAIRFYTQAQKVRFEFDIAQLAKVDVIASSELLKLARIIR
ncbi:hypothetical protein FX988_01419 [Paraglaciecola mesophila]|uniref:YfiR family protein n=2 Tax=Paraglaciecola mesophila TaxID=197222 RepID=A0A857JJM9_9ALTE|nr:hypothetical protein FX988_01419 [Paraglaciecola mesophila]